MPAPTRVPSRVRVGVFATRLPCLKLAAALISSSTILSTSLALRTSPGSKLTMLKAVLIIHAERYGSAVFMVAPLRPNASVAP